MAETFRVLIRKEFDQWVAQCLEVDICVQAPDLDTLEGRFEVALNSEDLAGLDPAPQHYLDIWQTARRVESPRGGNIEMKIAA
jgi:hypothetical protein